MQRDVVKLLKPDSMGHMQRLFSVYSWSSGTLEVLSMESFSRLVRDLMSNTPLGFDEQALFSVRNSNLLGAKLSR